MNRRFGALLLLGFLASPLLPAQEAPTPSPAPAAPANAGDMEKFQTLILEAQQLHNEQKYFEAFQKINEAEKLNAQSPLLSNIRGSLYTALRDFEKAHEQFTISSKLSPNAFEPKFNLAEVEFVKQNFAAAEKQFSELLRNYPKIRQEVRHLTQFKIIVSRLKQDAKADIKDILSGFTFLDDTPAYYFSHAAMAFAEEKSTEAQNWVSRASTIYTAEQNVPYLDSLIEARWIESIAVPEEKSVTVEGPKVDLSPSN